jgi:hypothetical protein
MLIAEQPARESDVRDPSYSNECISWLLRAVKREKEQMKFKLDEVQVAVLSGLS